MTASIPHYFLQSSSDADWVPATKAEFIRAERAAGFKPKYEYGDPRFMTECATGGFSGGGVSGKIEWASRSPDRPQEPKYEFRDGQVFNRATGEAIPLDEDVFIFRARDRLSVPALRAYRALVAEMGGPACDEHLRAIDARIAGFESFAQEHPDRMKTPDTDLSGESGSGS